MAITKKNTRDFMALFGLTEWIPRSHPAFPHKKFEIYLKICKQASENGINLKTETFALMCTEVLELDD
jgi:hypothetical protein